MTLAVRQFTIRLHQPPTTEPPDGCDRTDQVPPASPSTPPTQPGQGADQGPPGPPSTPATQPGTADAPQDPNKTYDVRGVIYLGEEDIINDDTQTVETVRMYQLFWLLGPKDPHDDQLGSVHYRREEITCTSPVYNGYARVATPGFLVTNIVWCTICHTFKALKIVLARKMYVPAYGNLEGYEFMLVGYLHFMKAVEFGIVKSKISGERPS